MLAFGATSRAPQPVQRAQREHQRAHNDARLEHEAERIQVADHRYLEQVLHALEVARRLLQLLLLLVLL